MAGLGFKLDQVLKQGPSKKCERCHLSYFGDQHEHCPHCTELNDSELKDLIVNKKSESKSGILVGRRMLVAAALLLLVMFFLTRILG